MEQVDSGTKVKVYSKQQKLVRRRRMRRSRYRRTRRRTRRRSDIARILHRRRCRHIRKCTCTCVDTKETLHSDRVEVRVS